VEQPEARPAQQDYVDVDVDVDFERPGAGGFVGYGFVAGDRGGIARGPHARELRGVRGVDARVGDSAGGVCGVPPERGGRARELVGVADEPPEAAVAALRDARDPEPLVREHAAWALKRSVR
jgi:hypothetical protein